MVYNKLPKPGMLLYLLLVVEVDTDSGPIDTDIFSSRRTKNDINVSIGFTVDDIIFGFSKKSWCDEFEALMKSRFQMSSMGELTFLLGLQVKQKEMCKDNKYSNRDPENLDSRMKMLLSCACLGFRYLQMTYHIMLMNEESLGTSKANLNWAFGILKSHHLTWKPILIVTMLDQILTGNPQQEVVNFLAGDLSHDSARSKQLWLLLLQRQKVGQVQLSGLEIVQEMTEQRKPMEFQVGDRVMLKLSPWKGVLCGKRGKLNPRYVGRFKVLEEVGAVAYKLELPQELRRVYNTFHVSNLKKNGIPDEPLAVPLEGLHVDDKL
ncbi:hypothetical protein Tco_0565225 [Tanacetum coccineum]